MAKKKDKPIKFYSDLHKALIPDLNRCPKCGEILNVGHAGRIYCDTQFCSNRRTISWLTPQALKQYYPETPDREICQSPYFKNPKFPNPPAILENERGTINVVFKIISTQKHENPEKHKEHRKASKAQ